MARETLTSGRAIPTAKAVSRRGKDRLRAIRKAVVAATVRTHTVVGDMDWVILRNDGTNNIKVNFKTDDMTSNYWTIEPQEKTPPIGIFQDVDINYQSVGGASTLEMILWA